ncbi:ganglioside GM2 activator-like [Limulus polyphemus]|uniref:Ganglioside GM2 activator-like n=1 Tax=Limulus polyphemus TaxID=6850 RepID=A0ABM1B5G7_LIMPO|nr:ganglioside GM2 activator-like [Limulus polyphemus]
MKQLYRITNFLLISFLIFHRNFVLSEKYESPYVNIFSLGFEQYLKNFHLFYNKTLTEMTRILSTPQIPERYWDGLVHPPDGMLNKDKILGFSWANCGSPDDPVQVKSLSISPDPIRVPGVLTVGFDILTLLNITSPQVDLVLQKKVLFFWIKVPCLNGFGSCSYPDACTLIPKPCPEEIKKRKLPCDCPVTKVGTAV